jgi:hypothetical protein
MVDILIEYVECDKYGDEIVAVYSKGSQVFYGPATDLRGILQSLGFDAGMRTCQKAN